MRLISTIVALAFVAPAFAQAPKLDLFGDPLPPGAFARMGTIRFRHEASAVGFLDERTVVSVGASIRTWDAATGKLLNEFRHPKLTGALTEISANGKIAVTTHAPERHLVWDTQRGKLLREFTAGIAEQGRLVSPEDLIVCVCADGSRFAAYRDSVPAIRVWNTNSDDPPVRLEFPPERTFRCMAISPDGRLVAVVFRARGGAAGAASRIVIWDVASAKELHSWSLKSTDSTIAFSPDATMLAVGGAHDYAIHALAGAEVWKRQFADTVEHITFTPDGDLIVISLNELMASTAHVHRASTGEAKSQWPATRAPLGVSPAVSPNSRYLVMEFLGRLRLFSLPDGRVVNVGAGHSAAVCSTCITPDGKYIASTDFVDNEVILSEVATGREVRRFRGHTAGCVEIVVSPDGKRLASSSEDRTVRIWDVATGKQLHKLDGFPRPVWHLRFLPDNESLALCAHTGGPVSVYHFPTGRIIHDLTGEFQPSALLRHPDGRILLIESVGSVFTSPPRVGIQVWDVMASRIIQRFEGHNQRLVCSILSPDGRTVATRGDDGYIRLWELATGQQRANIFEGEQTNSTGTQYFAFSPDGRTIASANRREPRVYLWDVPTGNEIAKFNAHERPMYTVEFTPDGRRMITGSQDSTMLGWDMTLPDRRSRPLPSAKLSHDDLTKLWAQLRDGSAAEAYKAKWKLAADPDATVAFLRDTFVRLKSLAPEQIQTWLADLDASKYAVREAAEKNLLANIDHAEAELHKAYPKASGEARRRISRILESEFAAPPPDVLREMRAVEVLDAIGTKPALDVLRDLSPGNVRLRVAHEATTTLKRLASRER
jgi:WD40 repeat protein